ncbi:MAG: extracellular solute-binding protein [Alphaproteobacteria bacterium]|nr:extracellular solute-binding protein [Alphaproteobacteria bacterium]
MKHLFVALLALLLLADPARAAHGIALWGDLKYTPDFTHFDYVNPNAPKGGTFRLSTNIVFDSLNPFILKGVAAPGVNGYIYQTLMTPAYDEPQSYYPLIASTITLAPDRAYADFTLNPNARWSDGKPVTVADVLWSFNTLKAKGHPALKVQYAAITAAARGTQTVRFTFADKTHRELPLIAAGLPVLPQHYFCDDASKNPAGEAACVPFDKTTLAIPVGSGPYKISRVEAGRSITFARDPHYWGANLPSQRGFYNFDTIRYDVYRDDTVALEGIKSHQFDFYEEFIARNWATAYTTPAVQSGALIKTLVPNKIPRGMQGFIFNTRKARFADRRVREAIGLTLDFEWMNRVLFYGAYDRAKSFFGNTEFEAKGLPDARERALLSPFSTTLPPALFTTEYTVPVTDGSGIARANLIRAQQLLNEAGWVMKDGVRVNARTGEPLTLEFLMTQRTFELVVAIMRHNLEKLGITASFRYVDASQYQKRLERKQFDIVSIWWNLGLFYPSTEQYLFWHSSQAAIEGSQNLAGVKNPAADRLVERIRNAQTLDDLRTAARALDRVLTQEHYVIPHWNLSAWRVAYWNQFGRPKITPAYNLGLDTWWANDAAPAKSGDAR